MRPIKSVLCALTLTLVVVGFARAQEPLDGPHRTFNDELLENLVGEWKLTRQIRGRSLENTVTVEWVLNQFLRVHMKDVQKPPQYEAMVFIGYDNTSERYVVHWIDVFGGRASETLGDGVRTGNSIKFILRIPGRPLPQHLHLEPLHQNLEIPRRAKDPGRQMDHLRGGQSTPALEPTLEESESPVF